MKLIIFYSLSILTFFSINNVFGEAISFNRILLDKKHKIREKVFITDKLCRVESPQYTYVIDLEQEHVFFMNAGQEEYSIFMFSELKDQFHKEQSKLHLKADDFIVRHERKYKTYRGQKTLKTTVVLKDKYFILLRSVKKNRREDKVRTFLGNLYNKLNFIPIKFTEDGYNFHDPLNKIILDLAIAFDYSKKGMKALPVYFMRPDTLATVEILDINYSDISVASMYDDFIKRKSSFKNLLTTFAKHWSNVISFIVNMFTKHEVVEGKLPLKTLKTSINKNSHNRTFSNIYYSVFWSKKRCPFFKDIGEKLYFIPTLSEKAYQIPNNTYPKFITTFKKGIAYLDKTRRRTSSLTVGKIDKQLQALFSNNFKNTVFETAKKKQIHLIRDNKLCYLKNRLYAKYEDIISK